MIKMKLKLFLFFSFLRIIQARIVNRIIGGRDAEPNSLPNMAFLQVFEKDPWSGVHFCSGTIVNPWWILVTANCASEIGSDDYPKSHVRVYVGKWSLRDFEPYQQIRRVREAYPHPNFTDDIFQSYNVGLIELTVRLVLNQFVKAFPLSTNVDYPSGIALIAGWGSAYLNEIMLHKSTNILQIMNVTLVSHQECLNDIRRLIQDNYEVFDENNFSDHIFCSGSYTSITGSSFIDSGNPLMQINELGGYDIVGVTSASGGPTLYVHVTPLLSWINSVAAIE